MRRMPTPEKHRGNINKKSIDTETPVALQVKASFFKDFSITLLAYGGSLIFISPYEDAHTRNFGLIITIK